MKLLDNNVIRVGGGVTVFRIRRFIQMMALIVCVASVTLLLYQNAYGMRVMEVSWRPKKAAPTAHSEATSNSQFQSSYFSRTQSYPLSANDDAAAANVIVDDPQIPFDLSTEWFRGKHVRTQNYRHRVSDYLLKRRLYEYSVTATPKPATISLNDIFISVKTTKLYHDTRLDLIIKTWFQLATDQVSDFGDRDQTTNKNMIVVSPRSEFRICIYSCISIHFVLPTTHRKR